MGFKSLIAKQVQGAMKILGTDDDGLAGKHMYYSKNAENETYDPVTRRVTQDEDVYDDIPMTFVRFQINDMPSDVKPKTDRRALIAALDLPVVPTEQDEIEIRTGNRNSPMRTGPVYTVMKVLSDPADALHILHVRLKE